MERAPCYDPVMLTSDELVSLSADAVALGQSIASAVASDSPGWKKITKQERAELFKAALKLAEAIGRDLVD